MLVIIGVIALLRSFSSSAIGDVGDMGIIMTENIYRHIATGDPKKSHFQKVYEGATEVGGAIAAKRGRSPNLHRSLPVSPP